MLTFNVRKSPSSPAREATVFTSVLIANRGEIAVRITRTLHARGLRAVAVYTDPDAGAPHVRAADEAFLIGPAVPAESYLNIDNVIGAAKAADGTWRSSTAWWRSTKRAATSVTRGFQGASKHLCRCPK